MRVPFFFFFIILVHFDDDHFDRCEVIVLHCRFDLHFPADVILCIFSCIRCPF